MAFYNSGVFKLLRLCLPRARKFASITNLHSCHNCALFLVCLSCFWFRFFDQEELFSSFRYSLDWEKFFRNFFLFSCGFTGLAVDLEDSISIAVGNMKVWKPSESLSFVHNRQFRHDKSFAAWGNFTSACDENGFTARHEASECRKSINELEKGRN